jgi:hypothetical protein
MQGLLIFSWESTSPGPVTQRMGNGALSVRLVHLPALALCPQGCYLCPDIFSKLKYWAEFTDLNISWAPRTVFGHPNREEGQLPSASSSVWCTLHPQRPPREGIPDAALCAARGTRATATTRRGRERAVAADQPSGGAEILPPPTSPAAHERTRCARFRPGRQFPFPFYSVLYYCYRIPS